MNYIDTHCHIHSADYPLDQAAVITTAREAGVTSMICVGTDLEDTEQAVKFVQGKDKLWASAGLHPHEAARYVGQAAQIEKFAQLARDNKVAAIGECGLDFYYNHSPKKDQIELLHMQLQLAKSLQKPVILHVRDAFDEFWPIFDQYEGLTGVVHSFTANAKVLDQIISRGLYVGLNGITTFMKPGEQQVAVKAVPLERMVLETDAPFLTPIPFRGTMNEPKYVPRIASHLADLRGEDLTAIAHSTTVNAKKLFKLE